MTKIVSKDKFGWPIEEEIPQEMARIGVEGGLDFRLYTEPLGNPSFHILGTDFEIVATIADLKILEIKRIEKSKYKFQKGEKLSGDLLKTTLSLMSKKVPNTEITRKQYLVILWNDNNPGHEIDSGYPKW